MTGCACIIWYIFPKWTPLSYATFFFFKYTIGKDRALKLNSMQIKKDNPLIWYLFIKKICKRQLVYIPNPNLSLYWVSTLSIVQCREQVLNISAGECPAAPRRCPLKVRLKHWPNEESPQWLGNCLNQINRLKGQITEYNCQRGHPWKSRRNHSVHHKRMANSFDTC